jgi:hypothetical protein
MLNRPIFIEEADAHGQPTGEMTTFTQRLGNNATLDGPPIQLMQRGDEYLAVDEHGVAHPVPQGGDGFYQAILLGVGKRDTYLDDEHVELFRRRAASFGAQDRVFDAFAQRILTQARPSQLAPLPGRASVTSHPVPDFSRLPNKGAAALLDLCKLRNWDASYANVVPNLAASMLNRPIRIHQADARGKLTGDIISVDRKMGSEAKLEGEPLHIVQSGLHYMAMGDDDKPLDVPGRGDCFYHALMHALGERETYLDDHAVETLRRKVATFATTDDKVFDALSEIIVLRS